MKYSNTARYLLSNIYCGAGSEPADDSLSLSMANPRLRFAGQRKYPRLPKALSPPTV
ncbi:hypothetical protein AGR1B_pa0206 [Agrobacterium fabacearum S56]|nr:hypothetical protein AGR1B_pa0206 [Agrobacterium fabacearum S56]